MAKQKKRRKSASPAKTSAKADHSPRKPPAEEAVTPAPPTDAPSAATLLDELQQRCESLRQWQRQTNEGLQARLAEVNRLEHDLDQAHEQAQRDRAKIDLDRDAIKRTRLLLDKEKAQAEQTQEALESHRHRLERAEDEISEQRQALQDLRSEMDGEWASLARTRRAQESLAAALDADRTRVQELRLTEGLNQANTPKADKDTDEGPGLSLTHAA